LTEDVIDGIGANEGTGASSVRPWSIDHNLTTIRPPAENRRSFSLLSSVMPVPAGHPSPLIFAEAAIQILAKNWIPAGAGMGGVW